MISVVPKKMAKYFNKTATNSKNQDWWLESSVIIYVFHEKNMFKTYSKVKDSENMLMDNHITYSEVNDSEEVLMDNYVTTKVEGK